MIGAKSARLNWEFVDGEGDVNAELHGTTVNFPQGFFV
jgi:hypothetical protein